MSNNKIKHVKNSNSKLSIKNNFSFGFPCAMWQIFYLCFVFSGLFDIAKGCLKIVC